MTVWKTCFLVCQWVLRFKTLRALIVSNIHEILNSPLIFFMLILIHVECKCCQYWVFLTLLFTYIYLGVSLLTIIILFGNPSTLVSVAPCVSSCLPFFIAFFLPTTPSFCPSHVCPSIHSFHPFVSSLEIRWRFTVLFAFTMTPPSGMILQSLLANLSQANF